MRDQSQKETLQRKAAQAQQKGQEAGEQEEKRSRSRRRKKKAGQSEGVPPGTAPAALQDYESPIRRSEPPKRGVRPGTLMDTGDAMPRTDFHRPNPLDSDVIMDATARLLAPRRSPLVPSCGGSDREESRAGKGHGSREGQPAPQPGQAHRQKAKSRAGQQSESKGAAPKGPLEKKSGGKKRTSRPDRRHSQPLEPRRNGQPKDSTEQPSLMKPYYLDIGR